MFPVFALLSPGPQLPEEGPVWSCRMCYFILFIKTKNIFCVFDMDGQAYATEISSLGTQEEGGWWVRWNRLNVQKSLSWANIFCLPSPCVQFHLILFHIVSWGGIIYIFISFYTSPLDISLTPQRKIHSMWKWKINVWKSLYTLKETFLFCLTQTTSSSLVFSSSVWK